MTPASALFEQVHVGGAENDPAVKLIVYFPVAVQVTEETPDVFR